MTRNWLFAITFLTMTFAATRGEAAVIPDFNFEAGSPSLLPSNQVSLPIFLNENVAPSVIAPEGLFSFGFSIARDFGDATIVNVVRNALFDKQVARNVTSTNATLWAEQDVQFGNGPDPDANSRILLATITFQQGLIPSEFNLSDYGGAGQTFTYDVEELDALIADGSLTISAIPEPATAAVMLVTLPLLMRRKR